jgi:hypothetical protein
VALLLEPLDEVGAEKASAAGNQGPHAERVPGRPASERLPTMPA